MIPKNVKKISAVHFSNFWSSKPWIRIGSGSGLVFSLKCCIRIRIKLIRIPNTAFLEVHYCTEDLRYTHRCTGDRLCKGMGANHLATRQPVSYVTVLSYAKPQGNCALTALPYRPARPGPRPSPLVLAWPPPPPPPPHFQSISSVWHQMVVCEPKRGLREGVARCLRIWNFLVYENLDLALLFGIQSASISGLLEE